MSDEHDLGDVDAFTTGTEGRPGQRTFYLQARVDGRVISVKAEKQQVQALGAYLARALHDLPAPPDRPLPSALELRGPVESVFTLGSIGVAYETDRDRFLVQLEELVPTDDEGEPIEGVEPRTVRMRIGRGLVAAFCEHAEAVVAAGRPACRFCGRPMDPDGHPCPRMN
ncbi:MAG: DUF3090 family protein [Acidimicrobiales bacterium]